MLGNLISEFHFPGNLLLLYPCAKKQHKLKTMGACRPHINEGHYFLTEILRWGVGAIIRASRTGGHALPFRADPHSHLPE